MKQAMRIVFVSSCSGGFSVSAVVVSPGFVVSAGLAVVVYGGSVGFSGSAVVVGRISVPVFSMKWKSST